MFDVEAALHYLIESGGSDLHVKVPSQPKVRLHGKLENVPGSEKLMPADTQGALEHVLAKSPERIEEFAKVGECDFSYAVDGLARFRVNAFRQRGSVSLVFRAIPYGIKAIEELMLPPVIRQLAEEERGIVLVTGTTGSGKSTTLAAMIHHINTSTAKHIITLEDPIEFLHRDVNSIIQQREVGEDTESFGRALRRILRQDPDVILIGEMRDEETVSTALSSAETGHLVFSTLHTINATETINRVIDFFPLHQNKQVRAMLAGTLRGVISQRLVPTKDGLGRVPICEVMVTTGRIGDMILDPDQTGKIEEAISEGGYYGMQTFDQALLAHLRAGNITMEDALKAATSPHDFKLMVAAGGKSASAVGQVMKKASDDGDQSPTADSPDGERASQQAVADQAFAQPAGVAPAAPAEPVATPTAEPVAEIPVAPGQ